MKRSGLFVSLLLAIILSNPAAQPLMASTADPFSVNSSTNAVVNQGAAATDEVPAPPVAAPEEAKPQTTKEIAKHTVQAGDSLWRIAQKLLGDGNRYREIIEANKGKYPSLEKNPDLIHAGWVLEVPVEKEVKPATDQKPAETKPVVETKKPEPKVEKDAAVSAEKVSKLPQWSTEEKVKRLQNALDSANRALLAQKKRIADLNEQTIRFLIDNKFMTEEDWMAMNPPEGFTFRLNRVGKIEVVGSDNKPLTSTDMAALDKKAKEAAKASAPKDEKKPAVETKPAVDKDKTQAAADAKAKQEASDKAAKDKAAAEKAAKEKGDKTAADKAAAEKVAKEKAEAEKKAAAEKTAKDKAEAEKAAQAKAEAEAAKVAETRYQKMLGEIGAPDFADKRNDYYKGIKNGSELLSKGFFGGTTAFFKFMNATDYPEFDVPALQRDLRESQKNYEKAVDKNKTSRTLGIFGETIDSAGKKVEESRARLEKAWKSLGEALNEAKSKAKEFEANVASNKAKAATAQKELDKLDKYDAKNADAVQKLSKELKNINESIKDDEEKLSNFKELKSVFKI